MRLVLLVVPVVLILSWSSADAAPIVVNAGDTYVFNVDFTGVVPAAPYPAIQFTTGLHPFNITDIGTWTLFPELNGGGIALAFVGQSDLGAVSTSDAGFTDGIFSVILTMTAGSITVDPFAFAKDALFGQAITANVTPTLGSTSTAVPEPATLTLLGGGLALGAARRRRRHGR